MRRSAKRPVFRRTLLLVGAVVPLAAAGLIAGPASASTRTTLPGSRPGWAANAPVVSNASASTSITVRVYLTPHGGEAALHAAVAAVSTPGSPQYRHFITPAQYRAQYGPDASSVASVSAWLAGAGMKVLGLDSGDRYVSATGTIAAAQTAFGVTLANYSYKGSTRRSPTTDASVPSSVAASVLGVTGLSTASYMKTNIPPPFGFRNAHPCSLTYNQYIAKYQADNVTPLPTFDGKNPGYAVCGYVPVQYRAAYGVDQTDLTGAGVTVAITDAYAASTILSDANTYATDHGDPAFADGQFTQSPPPGSYRYKGQCDASGWAGEETLDVEAVHGIALNANVIYYPGRSCSDQDLNDAMARVVDENTASIVTNSWGEPIQDESSGSVVASEQIFQQGALQGIGFMFSSGDNGDELANTGLKQTDYPTSDPYVTSVGGTSTGIGADGSVVKQTGWGTYKYSLSADGQSWVPIADPPFLYGAGGGFASLFNRPDWQNGVVPAKSPPYRAVPDISMDGDPNTGMMIGETQIFPDGTYFDQYRIGGTSLSSPLMAGMQALASEGAGGRLGFAAPAIYALAQSTPSVFTDVLAQPGAQVRADFANGVDATGGIIYSVRTFNQDSSLTTGRGWDTVTGVGVPNAGYLTAFSPQ